MEPRTYLRFEGLAALAAGVFAFVTVDGPLWLFVVLALAPDLAMAGYLAGPRVGAAAYNAAHLYAWPLLLGGVGVWAGSALAVQVAAVWAAHVGADRLVGYGLKYESGFEQTHLSTQPAPIATLTEREQS